ncbi:Crp/Fnr family transcriptional regulator [Actinoallomurus iriomotensis]|uniref:Crp/Fnr family transcriptional regulator n=1 Tax=Actinoallomurus iriomotensis TaxID=478107 RepID=A0A9W6RZH5_9ACTN|nr:Crp/Fnr family transcriptional regulator [Actinoallomurus iriomotensis]GLY82690.1 Crp/Fnr family transcriptional regulator [Actinoallomurus iriomotensis]
MPDDVATLRAVPLFAGLDRRRLTSLLGRSTARTVTAGTVVALRGDPAGHLIVVEAGALTAVRETARGRRLRLGEFTAPCTVDKAAVLAGRTHTATWLAATRTRIRLVPAGDLLTLIDEVPGVRHHVLRHLAGRLHDRQDDLVRVAFGDTTARVAGWLARAAVRPGDRVILPGAQTGLAESVGASRVAVNRALGALATAGLVRTEPGAVVVLAPKELAELAELAAE